MGGQGRGGEAGGGGVNDEGRRRSDEQEEATDLKERIGNSVNDRRRPEHNKAKAKLQILECVPPWGWWWLALYFFLFVFFSWWFGLVLLPLPPLPAGPATSTHLPTPKPTAAPTATLLPFSLPPYIPMAHIVVVVFVRRTAPTSPTTSQRKNCKTKLGFPPKQTSADLGVEQLALRLLRLHRLDLRAHVGLWWWW